MEQGKMDRDKDFEAQCLREAAATLGLEATAEQLHNLADSRAEGFPIYLPEGRDLVDEWIEEVADGVGNYGPWELQRLMEQGEDNHERAAAIWEALRHGILMYNALLQAKRAAD